MLSGNMHVSHAFPGSPNNGRQKVEILVRPVPPEIRIGRIKALAQG
jgi:hypothetical protein